MDVAKNGGAGGGAADPPHIMPSLGSSPGRALGGSASHKGGEGTVGSAAADPEPLDRIIPNKGRRRQVAPTRRKLFTAAMKAEFLEWFAATCNASLSARKVGIDYRTAFRHRREDPAFAEGWDEALAIGYVRLEELALRQAEAALKARRPVKDPPASPGTGASMRIEKMDAAMALQLLREHKRGLAARRAGAPGKPGRAPTVAGNAEIFEALVKRLKAFGVRIGRDGELL